MKGQQAYMHQYLLNAEFASGEYQKMHVIRVMKALTKVLHKSFCCTYACCQLHFLGYPTEAIVIAAKAGIEKLSGVKDIGFPITTSGMTNKYFSGILNFSKDDSL
jgi:hypothetical protein